MIIALYKLNMRSKCLVGSAGRGKVSWIIRMEQSSLLLVSMLIELIATSGFILRVSS